MGAYVATRQNLGSLAAPAVTAAVASPPQTAAAPAPEPPATPVRPPSHPAPAIPPEQPGVSTTTATIVEAPPAAAAPKRAAVPSRPPVPEQLPHRDAEDPRPVDRPVAAPAPPPAVTAIADTSALPAEEVRVPDPPPPPPPAARALQELVVPAESVIGLETETALSSERARLEDRVEARVVRDVRVNGVIAVPAGTKALGTVVVVERGNKLRERARLGIRFQTLLLPDASRLSISTDTIYRLGDAPGDKSTAKIAGGAVAGAILGAIINGGKGAAIGAAAGAGAGGAAVAAGDRSEAVFPAGTEVTARILAPLTVTLDK
jgi:hypothetical protein